MFCFLAGIDRSLRRSRGGLVNTTRLAFTYPYPGGLVLLLASVVVLLDLQGAGEHKARASAPFGFAEIGTRRPLS